MNEFMDWLSRHQPETWLGLAIVLGLAEMFSLDLILAMLAAGTGLAPAAIGAEVFKAGIASCVTVIPLISLPVAADVVPAAP